MARQFKNKSYQFYLKVIAYFLAAIVLVLLVCELLGWFFLRAPVEQFMASTLKREVKIGQPFKLHVLGGIRLSTSSIWISAPDAVKADHFVDAKDIVLKLRYRDLWNIKDGEAYKIQGINVSQISANLIRLADGQATWQFDKDPNSPPRPFPSIQSLVVKDGNVAIKDALTEADLKMRFQTDEGSGKQVSTSTISTEGDFRKRHLQSKLVTQGLLSFAAEDSVSQTAQSKGWLDYGGIHLTFDGTVSDLFGQQNVAGKLAIRGASLGVLGDLLSVTLPTTAPFQVATDLDKKDKLWTIGVTKAQVGSSDLSGHFKYDTKPDKPSLTGELKGKRFILADLAPAFGASNADNKKTTTKEARIFPDKPLDLTTYNRMNASVKVNIDYVELGSIFSKPIAPFKANINLNDNKFSFAEIDAKTADGGITGLISIDDRKSAQSRKLVSDGENTKTAKTIPANWHIDIGLEHVNLEKWLEVSDARKQDAKKAGKEVPPAYVTGFLNGKLKLDGYGNSTAELMKTLNGTLSLYVQNGTLSHLVVELIGLDVAQSIGVLVKGDQSLKLDCAVVDLTAKQGIFNSRLSMLDTPVTLVLMDGSVNMSQEQLNLKVTAEPKNFSPLTVRSPIMVTGPLSSPNVTPEKTPIIARVAGGLALAILNPLAAIIPFIDPGDGKNQDKNSNCKESLQKLKSTADAKPKNAKQK